MSEYNTDYEVRLATLEAMGVDPYVENGKTIPVLDKIPVCIQYAEMSDYKAAVMMFGNGLSSAGDIWNNEISVDGDDALTTFNEWIELYTAAAIDKFSEAGIAPKEFILGAATADNDEYYIEASVDASYKVVWNVTEETNEEYGVYQKIYSPKFVLATEEEAFNYTHSPRSLNNIYEVDLAILAATEAGGGGGGLTPVIVEELPESGESGKMYFVPNDNPEVQDNYKEYLWIDDQWECVGNAAVDLSDYATKDEVKSATRGVIIADGATMTQNLWDWLTETPDNAHTLWLKKGSICAQVVVHVGGTLLAYSFNGQPIVYKCDWNTIPVGNTISVQQLNNKWIDDQNASSTTTTYSASKIESIVGNINSVLEYVLTDESAAATALVNQILS